MMNPKQLHNDKMFFHHVVLEGNGKRRYLMKEFYHQFHRMEHLVRYEYDLFIQNKIENYREFQ
jgi:hypothetical protein